jgi:hypothetical protein
MSDVDYRVCLANLESAMRELDEQLTAAQRRRDSLAQEVEALKALLSSSDTGANQ